MVNIYEKAIQFIKIRPHHSGELRKKLLLRKFAEIDITQVLSRLQGEGLLNDASFGQNYLESLKKYKTFGYYGVKAKLLNRGLASNEAENLLKDNFSMEEELAIAQKLLSKERNPDRVRLAQKLSRKGFRYDVISRVLGNLSNNVV